MAHLRTFAKPGCPHCIAFCSCLDSLQYSYIPYLTPSPSVILYQQTPSTFLLLRLSLLILARRLSPILVVFYSALPGHESCPFAGNANVTVQHQRTSYATTAISTLLDLKFYILPLTWISWSSRLFPIVIESVTFGHTPIVESKTPENCSQATVIVGFEWLPTFNPRLPFQHLNNPAPTPVNCYQRKYGPATAYWCSRPCRQEISHRS